MKILIPLLALCLACVSCKKDEVEVNTESNCLFTTTSTSFSELNLSQSNNSDLFIMNCNIDDDAIGLTFDLNCDGTDDLIILGDADQDWIDFSTISSSSLKISTLNTNTFILNDSIADSTFNLSTADTSNLFINDYQLNSSYQENGSVFTSENINSYVTHVNSASVILGNDPRWSFSYSPQVVRNRYKNTSDFDYGPDVNGYTHYITDILEYNRGIVPNHTISIIPIKFITSEGSVKLGYIKLKPALYNGFISVGVDCWAIQR